MVVEDTLILSTFEDFLASFRNAKINELDQPVLPSDPVARVIITGVNEKIYNSVLLKQPANSSIIEECKKYQYDIGLPLTVWHTAETENHGLKDTLNEQLDTPGAFYGMLLDLRAANLTEMPDEIVIEQVDSVAKSEIFAETFCDVFGMTNFKEKMLEWTISQSESDKPTGLNYIAKYNGEVAGVSSLTINSKHPNTGGFYNASVLPALEIKELVLQWLAIVSE